MTIAYSQLAQARENSTNAVEIYSPSSGDTVQVFLKIANTTASTVTASVFHDTDGVIYTEVTALAWNVEIAPGQFLEIDKIFMNLVTDSLAYSSSVAQALTATVYGVVKT